MAPSGKKQNEPKAYMSRKQEKEQLRRQRMRRALNQLKEMLFQWNENWQAGDFGAQNSKLEDADVLEGTIRMLGHLVGANTQMRQQIAEQSKFASQFLFHQQMAAAMGMMANGSVVGNLWQNFGRHPANSLGEMRMGIAPSNAAQFSIECRQQSSSQIFFPNQNSPSKISAFQNGHLDGANRSEEWSDEEEPQVDVEGMENERTTNSTMANENVQNGEEEQDSGISINDLDESGAGGLGNNSTSVPKSIGGGKMGNEKNKRKKSNLWRPYSLE